MKLSQKALEEFKKIYLDKFGVNLTNTQANEKALQLLYLYKVVYRAIPND